MKKFINVHAYVGGQCFICKKPTGEDTYAHRECCLAYDDHKKELIKKENERTGN